MPGSDSPSDRSGLRQPQSVVEWRAAKNSAFTYSRKRFGDLVAVADRGLALAGDMPAYTSADEQKIVLTLLLVRCHGQLWNALDLLLERQAAESMAVLRPAVELAADAVRIARDNALAQVWLNKEQDEGAFHKAFKPRFPPGDTLSGPLYNAYQMCSEFGAHSTLGLSAFRASLDMKMDSAQATFHYFVQSDNQIELQLSHFIVTLKRILDVFAEGLAPLRTGVGKALADWRIAVELVVQRRPPVEEQ